MVWMFRNADAGIEFVITLITRMRAVRASKSGVMMEPPGVE